MTGTKRRDTHYGLAVYDDDADGSVWAVGTERQANKAAELAIAERLWAISPEFLIAFFQRHNPYLRDMSDQAWEELEAWLFKIQKDLTQDAEPLFRALIGTHMPTLCQDLLRFTSRAEFLGTVDDKEYDSSDVDALPPKRLAYRLE